MAATTNNRKRAVGSIIEEGDTWTVFYYVLNDKGLKRKTCKRALPSEKEAKSLLALKSAEFGEQERAFLSNKYVEDRSVLLSDYLVNHFENVYSKLVENSTETTYRYTASGRSISRI